MRMYDIIMKKRNGEILTKEEIDFFIEGYTKGSIPDYQISALLMAIYFQKMNRQETVDLTMAMVNSGETIDLSEIKGMKVDKHSTGGVGDTTTLVLGPLVAAAGVPVAKMSGRGLGHTGGTIDKLESFPNFSVEMSKQEFIDHVNEIKIAIGGQTGDLAPADKKLYALRDVTATVDNISLIASSIMSKKIAAGADGIVLDVKTGSGAFMKDGESAFRLGKEMVDIGIGVGKETVAFITEMDQPLGYAIGNALEVKEAIDTLKGKGPADLTELCLTLGSYMVMLGGKSQSIQEARKQLEHIIESGKGIQKLKELVEAQGGDGTYIDDPSKLPSAKIIESVNADVSGYVHGIEADDIGVAALVLGAGRETKESTIDLGVGIIIHKKVGDKVEKGEAIATVYANEVHKKNEAEQMILKAYDIRNEKKRVTSLIKGVITKEETIRY